MRYADAGLAQLARLDSLGRLISTAEVRRMFQLDEQTWHRLCAREGFPARRREGRALVMDPADLGKYLTQQNLLHDGLTSTQAARLARHTVRTLRSLVKRGRFPAPIGDVAGRPRFDREQVEHWLHEQRNGRDLPEELAITTRSRQARGG